MRKSRVFITILVAVVVSMATLIIFMADRTRPVRTKRPDRGLGYSPPAGAYAPGAGIRNSPHDLSANSGYNLSNHYNPEGKTNICIFCHIPHESGVICG